MEGHAMCNATVGKNSNLPDDLIHEKSEQNRAENMEIK
jgi:hypothetical protein